MNSFCEDSERFRWIEMILDLSAEYYELQFCFGSSLWSGHKHYVAIWFFYCVSNCFCLFVVFWTVVFWNRLQYDPALFSLQEFPPRFWVQVIWSIFTMLWVLILFCVFIHLLMRTRERLFQELLLSKQHFKTQY